MIEYLKKIKPIYVLFLLFLVIAFYFNYTKTGEQQFSYLAQSFMQGKTYFLTTPGSWSDAVNYNSHYYWPLGFFPAILLIPFNFIFNRIDIFFYQGYLQFFLGLIIVYLIYSITRKLNYSKENSIFWAFAFVFATAFIGLYLMPWSWYFAQVVTVALLFWLIYEYINKKRYWLLCLIAVLVLLTRITAGLGAFLFLFLDIVFLRDKKISLLKTINLSIISGLFGVVILGLYNFLRFGNIFESGYTNQILVPNLVKAREYGIFDLIHIPGNLFYLFLAVPLPFTRDGLSMVLKFPYLFPSPWGMSILVTSPYLIYLFFLKYKDKLSKILIATIFITLIPIITYYGIGFRQFGYRYAFDFMPFVFLLFMKNYKQTNEGITLSLKLLILFSAIFNMYLFFIFQGYF